MKIIRRCSITCLLLLVCLTAFPGQRSTANIPSKRYNIISIVTDDQASWTVGAYGNRESITPNMDRLHHAADQLDELYDLKNDPGETRNFYNNQQYQEVRNGLQKRLTAWQRSINDPLLRESRINFR